MAAVPVPAGSRGIGSRCRRVLRVLPFRPSASPAVIAERRTAVVKDICRLLSFLLLLLQLHERAKKAAVGALIHGAAAAGNERRVVRKKKTYFDPIHGLLNLLPVLCTLFHRIVHTAYMQTRQAKKVEGLPLLGIRHVPCFLDTRRVACCCLTVCVHPLADKSAPSSDWMASKRVSLSRVSHVAFDYAILHPPTTHTMQCEGR